MAMKRKPYRSGHRNAALLGKYSAIVLGLVAIGYVAASVGKHALPHLNAGSELHLMSPETTPGTATAVSGSRLSTNASPASEPRDGARGRPNEPRECRPDVGIVTECIFN